MEVLLKLRLVNSDNIFQAFKYAVDNEKLDYIRFITAGNPGVDKFNENIHKNYFLIKNMVMVNLCHLTVIIH